MTQLRGAVIGFGKLGLLHAGLISGLPESQLVAVVESSPLIRRVIGQHFPQVAVYDNLEGLISAGGIDLAVIATPTGSHIDAATSLVEASTPVLIEKPLCLNATQAEPLERALARRWVPNMVGYMGRYIETFMHAKHLLSRDVLGPVRMIRSSMYIEQLLKPGEGWRFDPKISGGGVLITQNSHVIDKLRWLFGEILEVSGHTNRVVSSKVEDHAHAYFRFASGAAGFLDASWSARHYRTPTISIHAQGDNGTLDVSDDEVRIFLDSPRADCQSGWTQWRTPDLYQSVPLDIGGTQYTRQMVDFLGAVRSGSGVQSDVASALRTQQVIDAIYESASQSGVGIMIAT